ncbi:MAG: hypothetical protein WC514_02605 [Candidatus Paceibacterota bacterium]
MAITVLEKRKFQRNLIIVFFGVCLITGIVIWNGFFGKGKISGTGEVSELVKPKKVEINFEILKSPLLSDFQGFEEIKPLEKTSPVGRNNPFVSY